MAAIDDVIHYTKERERGQQMVRDAEAALREAEQMRRRAEEMERAAKANLASARSWLATQEEMIVLTAARMAREQTQEVR